MVTSMDTASEDGEDLGKTPTWIPFPASGPFPVTSVELAFNGKQSIPAPDRGEDLEIGVLRHAALVAVGADHTCQPAVFHPSMNGPRAWTDLDVAIGIIPETNQVDCVHRPWVKKKKNAAV
jgi:hypothetical protein